MAGRLDGHIVLNTRPAHQQAALTALLERAGARVLSFPAIEIELVGAASLPGGAAAIADYDILLFVSRNAVDGLFLDIDADSLAARQTFGVIGAATRDALREQVGDRALSIIASEPFNSEALLETGALRDVAGKRVLILRGQPGRNLLGDELARRGARVDFLEVYRRVLPRVADDAFARLVDAGFPTLAVMTSDEGMRNLQQLVDTASRERLGRVAWLLISERMRESARELGHNAPIVIARNASDNGIFDTICAWAGQQKDDNE